MMRNLSSLKKTWEVQNVNNFYWKLCRWDLFNFLLYCFMDELLMNMHGFCFRLLSVASHLVISSVNIVQISCPWWMCCYHSWEKHVFVLHIFIFASNSSGSLSWRLVSVCLFICIYCLVSSLPLSHCTFIRYVIFIYSRVVFIDYRFACTFLAFNAIFLYI